MKKINISVSNSAEIISANKLSVGQMEQIINKFPNLKNKEITERVDKSLIAGFIIKQESDIFDASVNGKINYLLNKIYENYR
jgi:F0F1-type ATP synthase delta subunit